MIIVSLDLLEIEWELYSSKPFSGVSIEHDLENVGIRPLLLKAGIPPWSLYLNKCELVLISFPDRRPPLHI